MSVRRAFIWASAGRYLIMALNLGATLILARLLAPQEYGVTVIGAGIFAVAEALRALGGGAYLIQKSGLSQADIRACFTVSLVATAVITLALLLLSTPLARFFDMPNLARYVRVAALGYLVGPFIYPISALMTRQLAFGPLATIGVLQASVNACVSISLAMQGFGYMSFAWAGAISTATGMLMYLLYWKDRSIFRPLFTAWRSVLGFGVYDSATAVVAQLADTLPYFIIGRLLSADAVGLGQRAVMLCLAPERVILAGVGAVALPAFSQQAREGKNLTHAYLRAIELITAAQWPSLIVLIFLAHPLVSVLLGTQWMAVAPLLQILAGALFFSFPISLHYATVVATGAIRFMPITMAVQSIASIAVLTGAARHGLHAAVLSALVILPCNGLLSLLISKHFVGYPWADLMRALSKSLLAALLSALGPAGMYVYYGSVNLTLMPAVAALILCGIGWLAGLRLTRHPFLDEMLRVAGKLIRRPTSP